MKRVLIISDTDSSSSQMVRGYLQYFARKRAQIYSAGIKKGKINPNAIEVMNEVGIDISNQTSNSINDLEGINFDFIATISNTAKDALPYVPSTALKLHQHINDLTDEKANADQKLKSYRELRDDARIFAHKFSKMHFKGIR